MGRIENIIQKRLGLQVPPEITKILKLIHQFLIFYYFLRGVLAEQLDFLFFLIEHFKIKIKVGHFLPFHFFF